MPTVQDVIRTITITGKTDGVDQATDSLKKLADAQGAVAVVSDTTNKSVLSVQQQYDRQTLSVDKAAKSAANIATQTKIANDALAQGIITSTEHAARLDLINQKYTQASPLAQAFGNSLKSVQGQMVALSAGMGPVGVFMASFGPLGLAAAAGLGLITSAMSYAIAEANRMGDVARELRDLSDTTKVTTDDLQKLQNKGTDVGLTGDQVATSLERFGVQLAELQKGSGAFYDELNRVNPALVLQLATTKDNATAWNILAQAYAQADDKQQALIAHAAFGRGGAGSGRLLNATAQAGGIQGLASPDAMLSSDEVNRWADLKTTIDSTFKSAKDLQATLFTQDVLDRQKQAADYALSWSQSLASGAISATAIGQSNFGEFPSSGTDSLNPNDPHVQPRTRISVGAQPPLTAADAGGNPFDSGGNQGASLGAQFLANQQKQLVTALGSGASAYDQLKARILDVNAAQAANSSIVTDAVAKRAIDAATLQTTIQLEGQRISLLGQAATTQDLVKQKTDEITAARQKGVVITQSEQAAIIANTAAQKQSADTAILSTNNVVTAEQLRATKLAELNVLLMQHKLTQDQVNVSATAYEKVIVDTIAQQRVSISTLPQLTQQTLDWGNSWKQLDQFSTSSMNSLVTGLDGIVMHTTTVSAGFKTMATNVLSALDQMILKMTIAGLMPSSAGGGFSLASLFGGGSSGTLTGADATTNKLLFPGFGTGTAVPTGSTGGMVDMLGGRAWVHPAYFDNAPHFSTGGMITDDGVPIIAHPGERILNKQQTAAYNAGNDGSSGGVSIVNNNNFSGADPGSEARIKAYVDQSSKQTLVAAVQAVAKSRANNPNYLKS